MSEQSFAARLKSLREAAGLSQAELAQRAGMNRFGVAKLEQGVREPSWATVQMLARALDVEVGDFVVEDGETAEKKPAQMGRPRKAPAVAQDTTSTDKAGRGQARGRRKGKE